MKEYKFNKGNHYAQGALWRLLTGWWCRDNVIMGEFQLTRECWYPKPSQGYDDMNKLVGVGFGLNHHKNSIRITWKPDYDWMYKFFLFGYVYDNNKWVKKKICRIGLEKTAYVIDWSNYTITINGTDKITMENTHKDKTWGHYLYPYIGGNNVAEKDCSIFLKIV